MAINFSKVYLKNFKMSLFVKVAEEEHEECMEIPTETDGTLLVSTLVAQFAGASGLRFRCQESRVWRGIRMLDGHFYPPENKETGETAWGDNCYYCVFPKENKRKLDDRLENSTAKTKRVETKLQCSDLIVLGLPWMTSEQKLRQYFEEKYGEVVMAQVKKDPKSQKSKGFGFIRLGSYDLQSRALAERHMIDGRWCDVKIPMSKGQSTPPLPSKVFVGRCTEDLSKADLSEYFGQFGDVTDVFIPTPFRAFAFVTFADPKVAEQICGEDHIIKGVSVHVGYATPKSAVKHEDSKLGEQMAQSGKLKNEGPNDMMRELPNLGMNAGQAVNLSMLFNRAFVTALNQSYGMMGNNSQNQGFPAGLSYGTNIGMQGNSKQSPQRSGGYSPFGWNTPGNDLSSTSNVPPPSWHHPSTQGGSY